MHTLLQQQNKLHEDGTNLLTQTIQPILSKYGDITINGSYTYKLLYHPDIDIYVTSEELTKKIFIDLCAELLSLANVSKLKTSDRVNFPHINNGDRPTGYWVSPTIHTAQYVWSCDIWLQKPAWINPKIYRYDNLLEQLPDEQRLAILTLKQELISAGCYGIGKEFESVDIYDVVLKNPNIATDALRKIFSK